MDLLTMEFFQKALLGGVLIAITAPLIGLFLVLRRLAMIGDTLSHVSIAGVALGFLLGLYPIGMGLLFSVIAAFGIEYLRRTYRSYAELSIAIMMSGGIGLASLLFTSGKSFNLSVTSYLFGSIYTLKMTDLIIIMVITMVVLITVFIHRKELFILTFDEEAAAVGGLPVKRLNIMLSILTALVISTAMKIVGGLLVSSLLTIPAACSLVVAKSFKQALIYVIVVGEIAVLGGLWIAGIYNLAPGGTIVLMLISILILILTSAKVLRT